LQALSIWMATTNLGETLVRQDVAIQQWRQLPRQGSATQRASACEELSAPGAPGPLSAAAADVVFSPIASLIVLARAFVDVMLCWAINVRAGAIEPRRLFCQLRLCGIVALSCAPWADSMAATVQLYGVVDTYMMYGRNGGRSSVRMGSGGASDSYWGIRAVEDLGNGVRVHFRLEGDMLTTNGMRLDPRTTYNREANIAVSSESWGTLKLGKQFPLALSVTADPFFFVQQFSPIATGPKLVGELGFGVVPLPTRVNDAISYQTPSMNGLVLNVLYAPRYRGGLGMANGDRESSSQFVDGYAGAQAIYQRGPWTLSGSYSALRPARPVGPAGPLGFFPRTDVMAVSAAYTMGTLQTSIGYGQLRSNAPGTFPVQMMSLGALLQQGSHIFRAALFYRLINGKSESALGGMFGYDYQLSKRVSVYTRAGGFRNSPGSAFGVAANFALEKGSSYPLEKGASNRVVAFGISQRF